MVSWLWRYRGSLCVGKRYSIVDPGLSCMCSNFCCSRTGVSAVSGDSTFASLSAAQRCARDGQQWTFLVGGSRFCTDRGLRPRSGHPRNTVWSQSLVGNVMCHVLNSPLAPHGRAKRPTPAHARSGAGELQKPATGVAIRCPKCWTLWSETLQGVLAWRLT